VVVVAAAEAAKQQHRIHHIGLRHHRLQRTRQRIGDKNNETPSVIAVCVNDSNTAFL
jgi:hypothetical protein